MDERKSRAKGLGPKKFISVNPGRRVRPFP
jgi:hypothetical protein